VLSTAVTRHMTRTILSFVDEIRAALGGVAEATAPPIAAAVLRRAQEPRNIADVVLDMRNTKRAKNFRNWCADFRQAVSAGPTGAAKLQKMWSAIQEISKKWQLDLDEEVRYRTRKFKFGLSSLAAKGELEGLTFKDPIIFVGRRYRPFLFLNDIFRL
jgi:hypothetical protein